MCWVTGRYSHCKAENCSKTQPPSHHARSPLWKHNVQWKEWIFAEMHMKRKGSKFSISSIRLAAYTKHEYFICWISQLLCYSAASLGDMNGSGPQIKLCSFEDKTPRSFFFCKVIQALNSPLQSSFSKDADTWQGHWAPGHEYLLTCVHKASGILVGKAEIEDFCFDNHKLVLGLQVIQNYPF